MKRTWLLLDCNALCYRAYWTTGHLSHGGDATGTIYGFLKNLSMLQSYMNTGNLVFCFDHGKSKREELGVGYKENRRNRPLTPEQKQSLIAMRSQMTRLRKTFLKKIGFRNIFYQKGYEADDVIASVVKNTLHEKDEAVIISSDKDLWQLLRKNVWMYDPTNRKVMTEKKFVEEWNIYPCDWANVKAIAGCSTDGVTGIKGIGEKTAAKWIEGAYQGAVIVTERQQKMISEFLNTDKCTENLQLVKLPYIGVKKFTFKWDEVTKQSWRAVVKRLGMQSLMHNPPIYGRTMV